MRTTRAYIAGAGTTGLLIAAVALLLVVVSAMTAFHADPSEGDSDATIGDVVIRSPAAEQRTGAERRRASKQRSGRTRAVPREGARPNPPRRSDSGDAPGGRGTGGPAGSVTPLPDTGPPAPAAPDQGSGDGAPGGSRTPAPAGGGPSAPGAPLPGTDVPPPQAGGGGLLGGVTKGLGDTTTGVTGRLGATVGGVSPRLGSTVTETGRAVGGLIGGLGGGTAR